MVGNVTEATNMIIQCQSYVTPNLILQFIINSIVLLITGLVIVESKKKFLLIWIMFILFAGAITIALTNLPNFTHNFFKFFTG